MDGQRKDRSQPSVMSPGRDGMSGRTAKVKPRPSRHHRTQVEGFYRPMRKVPEVMTREGGVPTPCTRLQHLVDSEVLLKQKRQSDTPGLPSSQNRIWNGSPRELVRPRYRLPEPEGDHVLCNLLRATSCSDEQLLTSRAMCSSTVQVTRDSLHGT